ncbi:pyruvate kinase [Thermotoga sp. RQ2]|uniref:pyruvate kinase n=1 Tax=Thermotoga sp. (strain RQ2) TaxID=126740 RepID=UPI0001601D6A|nr:pyruvate kinase [Thermotoga sp. RQ2]ACB09092.1 pyruvate kinase [Thermotoga sp. RQ2]
MRSTKIVCTVGPRTDSYEMIEKMIDLGVNVFRINTSHGDWNEQEQKILKIKDLREKKKKPVAILIDLAGPKIRTGYLEKEFVELKEGQIFTLTTKEILGNEHIVSVNLSSLPKDVKKGDTILLSDGEIVLEVIETTDTEVKTVVKVGGKITHRRGVNVPTADLSVESITDRDREFIKLGTLHDVEFFALSFVRKPEDVLKAKEEIRKHGKEIPVISKIETKKALERLEEIIKVSDGIMVARGDLGVEIPIEEVPIVQKEIIKLSKYYSKPVIVATQILESMIENPFPTRAEVTDIANAIFDGADALLLTAETAVGKHPLEAIKVLSKVAKEAEKKLEFFRTIEYDTSDISEAISHACWQLSESLNAKLIITPTISGSTAVRVSKYNVSQPIVALTPEERTYYRLSLVRKVIPVLAEKCSQELEFIEKGLKKVEEMGLAEKGDLVVLTSGVPGKVGTTNTIRVLKVD